MRWSTASANVAHALLYDGKRRVHYTDDLMARITAERLIRHLAQAGFVLMRAEPAAAPPTSNSRPRVRAADRG